MRRILRWTSVILLISVWTAYAQETTGKPHPLPALDGKSAKGLEIECRLVKTTFLVGEPVNIWCTIKNTTDNTKPVGWHPSAGSHFCQVQGNKLAWEGVLPVAIPQLDRPIMIRS